MGSRYNVAALLFTGLLFHLVYIGSVFDCYFTSPVLHGMQSHGLGAAESKRLVLIVADGLRAELLFQKNGFPPGFPKAPEVVAPYLRSIVETRGAFGISHTRVPTESKSGHVTITGGMYDNPHVDFDSVFNQSSTTFSFGSPDIVPMFSHGAAPGKVMTWGYDEEEQDFTKDATALDMWAFDHLESLLQNATMNSTLGSQLRAPGTVFFLHLLGMDTTGHSYRPHSQYPEYMNNLQVVDSLVLRTERLIEQFYQDEDTSYIFTSDHGMSTIGNHGDGHPDNTRTPLIAWGRGIRGPLPDSLSSSHDAYSEPWEFNHLLRRDIEQAGLAPLMATLVGINWPVNSVGVLPAVDPTKPGYLLPRGGDKTLAEAAHVNAKMILEQYRIKHELKKADTVLYKPFGPLEESGASNRLSKSRSILSATAYRAKLALSKEQWGVVRQLSADLIREGLEGLRYLQTYERVLIKAMATAAYTGWAAYTSLFIFRPLERYTVKPSSGIVISALSVSALASFWVLFAIEWSPWRYYFYIAFPCYFWHQFMGQILDVAYTYRSLWSLGFLIIGTAWPLWSSTKENRSRVSIPHFQLWTASCLVTGIFPLLAVNKTESLPTILAGGFCMIAAGPLFVSQTILIALAMIITSSSVCHLQAKLGLPMINQVAGWLVLIIASILPFVSRLLMYFLAFGPCFVFLSISVEGLFYVAYSITLASWIKVERPWCYTGTSASQTSVLRYTFQPDDIQITLFFLFFAQVGFFWLFELGNVRQPMTGLTCHSGLLAQLVTVLARRHALHLPPFSLFLVALTLTDGMTLTFFFNVMDTGSWLKIGQMISFFCITSLLLVWSTGVCVGGGVSNGGSPGRPERP
ncbi:Phosphatidylinositolglycan class N-domain-containing protein [Mycena maculata]|uniref:GPI ethanolamine phosphate transferase 1 n=1 Tax=Mycena maculata TaxID=230809 RepID=A0AAD7K6K8_9AGAR|nr:Phosphatidylinositolglycan class N-domain-containing protein [Mycena maculata]